MISTLIIIVVLVWNIDVGVVESKYSTGELKYRTNHPFNQDSQCFHALNFEKYGYLQERLPKVPRITLSPKIKSCAKLKIVNPGPGTTGTRSIQSALCDVLWIRSWHFKDNCAQTRSSGFRDIGTFQQLDTFHGSPRAAKEKITRLMQIICAQAIAIGDTPSSELFLDLSLLAPHAVSIFTFRNPSQWAARRVAVHAHEVHLCEHRLWDHPAVLHPFDLLGCLDACRACAKPFTSLHAFAFGEEHSTFHPPQRAITDARVQEKISLIEEAYVRMNTVNMMMAARGEVLPLCLWDMHNATVETLAETILHFLKNSSVSRDFVSVSIHHAEKPPRIIATTV